MNSNYELHEHQSNIPTLMEISFLISQIILTAENELVEIKSHPALLASIERIKQIPGKMWNFN